MSLVVSPVIVAALGVGRALGSAVALGDDPAVDDAAGDALRAGEDAGVVRGLALASPDGATEATSEADGADAVAADAVAATGIVVGLVLETQAARPIERIPLTIPCRRRVLQRPNCDDSPCGEGRSVAATHLADGAPPQRRGVDAPP